MTRPEVEATMRPIDQVRAVAILLLVSGLFWRAWAAWGAWFYADDFLLLATARSKGLSVDMLITPNDSQLMPFGMVIVWLVGLAPGLAWWPAALSLVIMQAAALASCYVMVRSLCGDRWLGLIPLGLFAFSPMAMDNSLWWAAALNGLPAQTGFFLLVTAAVLWYRDRQARWALLAFAAFTLAVASGPRGLLIALPIGILMIGLLTPAGRWIGLPKRIVATHWPLILPPAVVGIVYLAIYRDVAPAPLSVSTNAEHFQVMWNMIGKTWAPALLGGPGQWKVIADPIGVAETPLVVSIVSVTITFALLATAVVRGGRAGRVAVFMVLAQLVATYISIDFGRALQLGPGAALNTRYYPDVLAVCVAAVAVTIGGLNQPRPRQIPTASTVLTSRRYTFTAVSMVAALAISVVSITTFVLPWHRDFPAREFVANGVTTLTADPREVADVEVPELVQLPISYPANLPSRLFKPFADVVRARDHGNDLLAFAPNGSARPATVAGASSGPGPKPRCGWVVDEQPVRISMTREDMDEFPWTALNYAASGDGRAVVTFDDRSPFIIDMLAGPHTWFVKGDGRYSTLEIRTLDPGLTACLDGVRAGILVADR